MIRGALRRIFTNAAQTGVAFGIPRARVRNTQGLMRSLAMNRFSRVAVLVLGFAGLLHARIAFAQDAAPSGAGTAAPSAGTSSSSASGAAPVATAAPTGAPPPVGPAAFSSTAPASAAVQAPDNAPVPIAVPPVELLPPSGYPSTWTHVRGIYGGSLWLENDLQGMQWPYYPKTGLAISGSGWVDTGYQKFHGGEAAGGSSGLGSSEARGEYYVQQSRFLLRATPTWAVGDKFFVQGQTELVAAKIDTTQNKVVWGADDAWIRFGMWNKFDVQVGRFLPWEVYHYGMGLDLYTLERNGADQVSNYAPQIYGVTYMYQRQDITGQGAIHLYPFDWLRFEGSFEYGPNSQGQNASGFRPVAVADFPLGNAAVLRLKGGAEFVDSKDTNPGPSHWDETVQEGGGGALELIVDPYFEIGGNAAYGWTDNRPASGQMTGTSRTQTNSVGGFANVRVVKDLLVGGGINYTYLWDQQYDPRVGRTENFDQWQPYGAAQYLLWNHLFIKGVFAYASADLNPVPAASPVFRNEVWSARLRLLYLL